VPFRPFDHVSGIDAGCHASTNIGKRTPKGAPKFLNWSVLDVIRVICFGAATVGPFMCNRALMSTMGKADRLYTEFGICAVDRGNLSLLEGT
jgi:hypothetical protein